jgi:putative flippase GtrA
MHLLVHRAHLPVLAANAAAILACSVLNFAAGDRWVFPGTTALDAPQSATFALPQSRNLGSLN